MIQLLGRWLVMSLVFLGGCGAEAGKTSALHAKAPPADSWWVPAPPRTEDIVVPGLRREWADTSSDDLQHPIQLWTAEDRVFTLGAVVDVARSDRPAFAVAERLISILKPHAVKFAAQDGTIRLPLVLVCDTSTTWRALRAAIEGAVQGGLKVAEARLAAQVTHGEGNLSVAPETKTALRVDLSHAARPRREWHPRVHLRFVSGGADDAWFAVKVRDHAWQLPSPVRLEDPEYVAKANGMWTALSHSLRDEITATVFYGSLEIDSPGLPVPFIWTAAEILRSVGSSEVRIVDGSFVLHLAW